MASADSPRADEPAANVGRAEFEAAIPEAAETLRGLLDADDVPDIRRTDSLWDNVYAYAYLTALLGGAIVAGAYATSVGWISVETTVAVNADLGWVAELLAAGLVGAFLLWTLVQVVRVPGIGFLTGLVDPALDLMDGHNREA